MTNADFQMMFLLAEPEWYRMIKELVAACNTDDYSWACWQDKTTPIWFSSHPAFKTAYEPVAVQFGWMLAERIVQNAKNFEMWWYDWGLDAFSRLSKNPALQEYLQAVEKEYLKRYALHVKCDHSDIEWCENDS